MPDEIKVNIDTASVKVMRSHDYCHFEVCLSTTGNGGAAHLSAEDVDNLRKAAARLADKAVEQYKVAKKNAELRESEGWTRKSIIDNIKLIEEIPESDRTPESKARLKSYQDQAYAASRPTYDYEDDWSDSDDNQ